MTFCLHPSASEVLRSLTFHGSTIPLRRKLTDFFLVRKHLENRMSFVHLQDEADLLTEELTAEFSYICGGREAFKNRQGLERTFPIHYVFMSRLCSNDAETLMSFDFLFHSFSSFSSYFPSLFSRMSLIFSVVFWLLFLLVFSC